MRKPISAIAGVLTLILLVGCGGGGGGGSSSPYTGVTTQAALDNTNQVDVAEESYRAGDMTASAVTPMGTTGREGTGPGDSRAVSLVRMLRDVVERMDMPADSGSRPLSGASAGPMDVVAVVDTIYDGLGGRIDFSLTLDTLSGDFYGTFTFVDWHGEGGGAINGATSVRGHYEQGTGTFTQILFTFHTVTMVDGAESVTLSGTVELSATGSPGSATIEMYFTDNLSGKCVWIHNYTVTVTEGTGYSDIDLIGTIYLHDHGYVGVSTPSPFRFYDGYTSPSTGILLVQGAAGRKVRLVVVDGIPESSGYFVQADLDADDVFEWTSITYPWV